MKVISTYNIKGGVGKTSAAVNLAWLAARDGQRTLLWDLDPQAAATFLFRVRPKVKGGVEALVQRRRDLVAAVKATDFDCLDLVPADFSYRTMDLALDSTNKPTRRLERLLAPLAHNYDLVILDCPPSVSLVSESVLAATDLLVVPLAPSPLSLRTFDQLTEFVATAGRRAPRVLAFFSMVDRRRRLHRDIVRDLPSERRGITQVAVPDAAVVERMGEMRAPLGAWAPASDAALAYEQLWARITAETALVASGDL